jgi:hypothetical protein
LNSNRVVLAQLATMDAEQVAGLPIDQISLLLEDVAEQKAQTKRLDEKLSAALNLKYAKRAAELRREAGKDTGTVTIQEDGYIVRADLPKAVEWSEFGLREVERSWSKWASRSTSISSPAARCRSAPMPPGRPGCARCSSRTALWARASRPLRLKRRAA